MSYLKSLLLIIIFCQLVGCGLTPSEKCNVALTAGNLSEAEAHLKEIRDADVLRYYGGLLIDEYLSIDKLDRAIYVFDNITGHKTMSEMQFGEYSQIYSAKIYKALIKADRYDDAWNYHALSYCTENYPGNAPDYFSYMTDCMIHMCNSGKTSQAFEFMKQKRIWFLNNVDNHEWGKDYPNYCYDIMSAKLNKVLNEYQQ